MERNDIVIYSWIVFAIVVLSFATQIQLRDKMMKAYDIEIPTSVYEKGQEISEGAIGFVVCDLEDNKCLSFGRLPELHQGPVPQGYNENHFRKTGETILE